MFKGRKKFIRTTGVMELKVVKAEPINFEEKLAFSTVFRDKENKELKVLIFDNYYNADLLDTLELVDGEFVELDVYTTEVNGKDYVNVRLPKESLI